jgi:geranylgeranyl diphosphate synthase type II
VKEAETSSRFERYLERVKPRIDAALHRYLPAASDLPGRLHASMRYSVFAGGKRLRPVLCLLACESVCGKAEPALPAAAALEMIHTFSLIHDDLPGMDDDDYRRGRLANHKVFGEGMAILAGDALLALGFGTLLRTRRRGVDPCALLDTVIEATGTRGMIGGQALDLLSERKRPGLNQVLAMHRRKTGMLLRGSLLLGAQVGGATAAPLRRFGEYGDRIGLAFQVVDDILNVRATARELGKAVGSDEARGKATVPAAVGIAGAGRIAERVLIEARAIAPRLGRRADEFASLTEYLLRRTH